MTKQRLRVLLGTIGLFFALPAAAQDEFRPPQDGHDWIQLTSGEWLKGEVFGLFNDELEFDSEILEELTIDWEDVAQIVSPRKYGVRADGRDTLRGELRFEDNRIIVVAESGEYEIAREDLLGISQAAEREIDRWQVDVTFGLNVKRGNTDFVEQNAQASAERRTPVSRATLDYVGSYNETEGDRVANNHRVNGVLDRFGRSKLFWRPVQVQYYRDEFQNIAHQATLSTGLGYELRDTKKTDWLVFASVGGNYLDRVSVGVDDESSTKSPSITLGTDFETDLTSWIEYEFSYRVTFLDEQSGERQHHLITSVSTDLIRNIDFDVSFIWDRTDKPRPDANNVVPERDDFRFTVGLGFEF